jgi:hypothetical protein
MMYASISRNSPTCYLFVVDQSSSMAQQFGDRSENQTKAEGVALALNNLLRNLIITCSKSDGVRNYFHIGVIGYGERVGPAWGGALLGQELAPVGDVARYYTRVSERTHVAPDPWGNPVEQTTRTPVWVEPAAKGSTPMCTALALTHRIAQKWMLTNQSGVPPVVVHITDGEATDGDPAPYLASLSGLHNAVGPLTLFNVHLSSNRGAVPIQYPDSAEKLPDAFSRLLFDTASPLTPFMRTIAWDNGLLVSERSRAFVLNADPTLMALALEIGTRPGGMW